MNALGNSLFIICRPGKDMSTRRVNPDGSIGGWVSQSALVDPSATVDFDAHVMAGAIVGPGKVVGPGQAMMEGSPDPVYMDFLDP